NDEEEDADGDEDARGRDRRQRDAKALEHRRPGGRRSLVARGDEEERRLREQEPGEEDSARERLRHAASQPLPQRRRRKARLRGFAEEIATLAGGAVGRDLADRDALAEIALPIREVLAARLRLRRGATLGGHVQDGAGDELRRNEREA